MEQNTNGQKTAIVIIVLLLIGGGIYLFFSRDKGVTQINPPGVVWRISPVDVPKGESPQTEIGFHANDRDYDVGTFKGSCAKIAENVLSENEIAGVVCLYSGHGDEIGVFKENSRYVVKHGDIKEPDEESTGSRGDFTTLFPL